MNLLAIVVFALLSLIPAATVVCTTGKAIITNRIFGTGTEPKFIGWGTGAGTAVVANTTLFTEAAETRTTGTSSQQTTTTTGDTHRVVGTLTSLSGQTITNVGLFDAVTVGNLYIKADFTGLALLTGDSIAFTINMQLT